VANSQKTCELIWSGMHMRVSTPSKYKHCIQTQLCACSLQHHSSPHMHLCAGLALLKNRILTRVYTEYTKHVLVHAHFSFEVVVALFFGDIIERCVPLERRGTMGEAPGNAPSHPPQHVVLATLQP